MAELLHGDITEQILGAAFEVRKTLPPGLLETVYETALVHELELRGLAVVRQARFRVPYKAITAGEFVVDLLVEGKVIVELKATSEHSRTFEKQIFFYLRASGYRVGLLLNFGTEDFFWKRIIV